jgi:hypothetical protein
MTRIIARPPREAAEDGRKSRARRLALGFARFGGGACVRPSGPCFGNGGSDSPSSHDPSRSSASARVQPQRQISSISHMGRRRRGDAGMIEGRRDLDHVAADQVDPRQPPQERRLPALDSPPQTGVPVPGRKGRVEPVDVEAEVDRRAPPAPARVRPRPPARAAAPPARRGWRCPDCPRPPCGCRYGPSARRRSAPPSPRCSRRCRGRCGRGRHRARCRYGRRPGSARGGRAGRHGRAGSAA